MIIDECNFLNPDIYAELLNSSCFLHDDNDDDDDDGDDEEDKQDEKDEDDNDNYYEYESDQCEEGDDGGGGGGELWDVDTTPLLPRPPDVVTTAIDAAMLISDHRSTTTTTTTTTTRTATAVGYERSWHVHHFYSRVRGRDRDEGCWGAAGCCYCCCTTYYSCDISA